MIKSAFMAKPLSILFVTGECSPFAKETSIADIASAYPLAVRGLGHDIRLMIPKHGCISERKNKIHDITRLQAIPVSIGSHIDDIIVAKSSGVANTKHKAQMYLATNERYFESHKGIYHEPNTWVEFKDNLERFAFFSMAVVNTCIALGWTPDIVHCNGWQTVLVPVYMRYYSPNKFSKTRIVMTINDATNQGEFPLTDFKLLGLPEETKASFTHKKMLNLIKGGMLYSNYVTTLSPTYASQMLKDKVLTNGLNEIIKPNANRFEGILSGIDSDSWNPRKDIYVNKLKNNIEDFKKVNKKKLCEKFGLPFDENVPVIGMITALNEMKGIDVFLEATKQLLKMNVCFVILGQGNETMKKKISAIQNKNPNKFAVKFLYDDALAHLIEAGSDMFLSTARYECSGLNTMYSINYGSIPIVCLTGANADIAVPIGKKYTEGMNCFTMKTITASNIISSVSDACETWKNKEKWNKIIENGLNTNFNWTTSAKQYIDLYRRILAETK